MMFGSVVIAMENQFANLKSASTAIMPDKNVIFFPL